MSTETTTAMQDALQAAVRHMNNGAGTHEVKPPPVDPMGLLMTVVPKLLQGSASSGEMVEKLEALRKDDLHAIREQVRLLRRQCQQLLTSQEQVLARVDEVQQQQLDVGRAVLDLARQLARINVIEGGPDDLDDDHEPEARSERVRYGIGERMETRAARAATAERGYTGRPGRS